jgi:hypothetical protein
MVHANAYINNLYSNDYRFRGVNLYAKYRFLSKDNMQEHFRMAAFARISQIFQPGYSPEVNIEGEYSGANAGVVATQLLHKLAIASSITYNKIFASSTDYLKAGQGLDYTLSFGYLLFPKSYIGYKQTNFNLYLELLGKTQWATMPGMDETMNTGYLDAAPGIQFIFHSITRLDFSWRTQLISNMDRPYTNAFFIRLEHNIFNVGR